MAIRVLPAHIVNKIAAGEVVERPASIVKELVENSLDAGATSIEIAVEDGGRKLISVADNGCGMGADDLALTFAPHATSKISTDDDLFAISTMGFRGEALASIAAISHAHIRSRTPQAQSGYEVAASGDQIGQARPCAAPVGTAVTVRDLFFNTPARRKFMRTANTEFGHVCEQLARLALPHPKVSFRLTHNGRESQNLPAVGSTQQRISDLFGQELSQSIVPVRPRGGNVRIAGLLGLPAAARASGNWQYFFLNGRYIRDRLLSHALREAYRGLVDQQRWPVAFIFIEIDPAEVDVNVHPTKIEVRFRDSQNVHGSLLAALRETLNQASLAPSARIPAPGETADASPAPGDDSARPSQTDDARRSSLRQALTDFFKSAPPPQPRLGFSGGRRPEATAPAVAASRYQPRAAEATPASQPATAAETPAGAMAPDETPSAGGAIQIHNSYIVTAAQNAIIIIDQHALHERLIYNDLKQRLTAGPLTGQRLLLPETLKVTQAEAAALQDHAELLAMLGIELEPFGPDSLAVQQFPTLLAERGIGPGQFVRQIADMLAEDENAAGERLLEGALEMMACKAAVKAGDPLSPAEIAELLARRQEAEKGSACPHGRPTTLSLTFKELDKQFERT
jgi:DNA mismatch repair protein MutL